MGSEVYSKFWEEGIVPAKKGFKTWNLDMNTCIFYFYDHFNRNHLISSSRVNIYYLQNTLLHVTGMVSSAGLQACTRSDFYMGWDLNSGPHVCRSNTLSPQDFFFFFYRISNSLGWPQIPRVEGGDLERLLSLHPSLECWDYRWPGISADSAAAVGSSTLRISALEWSH